MSWYNSDDTSFIDATQTFTGGGGSLVVTGEGGGTDIQLSDLLELKLDHLENQYESSNPALALNLYLKNENANGEIRFYTEDAVNNNDVSNGALTYNTKIGSDGKLYIYYTYNPLISAAIFSGWTNVVDNIIANKQAGFNNAAAIATTTATLQTEITTLDGALAATNAIVGQHTLLLTEHEAKLLAIAESDFIDEIDDKGADAMINIFGGIRDKLSDANRDIFDAIVANAQGSAVATSLNVIRAQRFTLATSIGTNLLFGGSVAGIIGLAYALIDRISANSTERDITAALKTLEYAKNEPDKNVVDKIYIGGLQIDQTTNNGFTTAGTYDDIDAGNSGKITIEITSGLLAEIKSVDDHSTGSFSVGDVITIPKSSIGGTTGNLLINVTAVASVVEILERYIIEREDEATNIETRNRRRRFIPDKNDFNNGLDVTETNITEPSGEITKSLDISLKLDTSQFQYDASGNLQIQNYGTIPVNAA
ncbi:MAG: hypothetical protein OET18_16115, partial [Desulfobacterales bacterium]|nr:hypothetical protein [Desulfobacterales bacterium]